jgi:hypothetical protein
MKDVNKKNKELSPRQALKKANAVDKRIQNNIREVKQLESQLKKKKEISKLLSQEYSMYIQLAISVPNQTHQPKEITEGQK